MPKRTHNLLMDMMEPAQTLSCLRRVIGSLAGRP